MSALPPGAAPGPILQPSLPGPPSPAVLPFPPPVPENGASPVAAAPPGSSNSATLVAMGVGIGIGGALVLVCVGVFVIWYMRKIRRLRMDGVGCASSQPQGPKGDPFCGPLQNLRQHAPPPTGNDYGLAKPTPPLVISSNSQSSSMDVSTPPPPFGSSSLNSEKPSPQAAPDTSLAFTKISFTYEELALATDHFSSTNLLGQGGFGYVHKGVLSDGKEVAIKQLKVGSGQGEREFQAEVETISHVHHKHLVSLVGHCISGTQRLLVYEYVPNHTLEFHLHGKEKPPINWATRVKIALGSAQGLAYLHDECHPKIIHRDIKSANILLDENFEAKVADFGLARLSSDADTHISTRVMGTFGYLAPEYALTGKLTDKSDVFSFGVVLLELITGFRPIDKSQKYLDDNIIDWARPLLMEALENDNFDSLADSRLQKDYDTIEMTRMVACASACVRHLARRRPQMSQIARALEGKLPLDELNESIHSGHTRTHDSSHGSSDYDTKQYKDDLIKFRKMALEYLEATTSEFSGPTSEFGHQPSASSTESLRKTLETQQTET